MLGLTKPAAAGQQGRPLPPQDAAASCRYVCFYRAVNTSYLPTNVSTHSCLLSMFKMRMCMRTQVPSACAPRWHESDRFAWRTSKRPLAGPSGQAAPPLHRSRSVCSCRSSGGTTYQTSIFYIKCKYWTVDTLCCNMPFKNISGTNILIFRQGHWIIRR